MKSGSTEGGVFVISHACPVLHRNTDEVALMMSTMVQAAPSDVVRSEERQQLLSDLLEAVQQCQIRFGGRAELATESDSRVAILCTRLEAVLSHGLRVKPLSKNSSTFRQVTEIVSSSLHLSKGPSQEQLVFWHYVREHLTRHEYDRYLVLKQIWTDVGRGRAWLRSSLNECSLERYLHCVLGSLTHLAVFYEHWAFLLDQERSSMLPTMAAGLGSILFAISIDNKDFNQECIQCDGERVTHSEPIIPASKGLESTSKRKTEQRRRKRLQPQIISFDDDITTESSSNNAFQPCPTQPLINVTELAQEASDEHSVGSIEQQSTNSSHLTKDEDNATKNDSQDADCIRPKELSLSQPSLPASVLQNVVPHYKADSRNPAIASSLNMKQATQTLTPVNNVSVGELIPVSMTDDAYSEEDSLSVPSYSEDTECAAAALLATQRLLQTNCVDFSPQEPLGAGNRSLTDPTGHVNGEMHEALLTVLSLKEELQAEARSLQKLLIQSEDMSSHLQIELAETTRQYNEKVERLEIRIQALVRENELLKHQLRKYVGAVQMLKRDGSQAHEALASLEAAQPKAGESSYPDYHHEAREYEKKLIQVAEMHGELMEFNDRLHRLLQLKDMVIRRLREELVDLRGPLPDDVATSDDDVSVTSDYDNSSLCAAARALVNIWIPSAFLTGGSSDVHHVYQVFIRIRDDEWNIYRRYAQFYSLHKELKRQDAVVGTFDFPPKKTLGNKDARFVEERRRRLQHYLRCVMNHLVQTNPELASTPDKELLIGLIPFFGEICNIEDKSRRKRPSSRNPFSRLTRNTEGNQTSEHSPQYTGL